MELSRWQFLNKTAEFTAAGILVPKVGIGERPQIETPRNFEFLLPSQISAESIGLSHQQIVPTGLVDGEWFASDSGLNTPIENPHVDFGRFWDMRNTTYIFGHSDFNGQRQIAADFEKLNPGDVVTLDEVVDKMTGKKIINLNYIVNQDGLLIADLDQILEALYKPHPASKPRYPRLILQTTFRTDKPDAKPLIDESLLERARYNEETIHNPSKYLCLLVIANLAK